MELTEFYGVIIELALAGPSGARGLIGKAALVDQFDDAESPVVTIAGPKSDQSARLVGV